MAKFTLLSAASATGSAVNPTQHAAYDFDIYGTWDGATATLQSRLKGDSTWLDEPGGTFTDDGTATLQANSVREFRVAISSAGGSTSLTATMDSA